jgi:hypothetical protein
MAQPAHQRARAHAAPPPPARATLAPPRNRPATAPQVLSNSLGGCAAALLASGMAMRYQPFMMRVMEWRILPHLIPTAALAAFLVRAVLGAGRQCARCGAPPLGRDGPRCHARMPTPPPPPPLRAGPLRLLLRGHLGVRGGQGAAERRPCARCAACCRRPALAGRRAAAAASPPC